LSEGITETCMSPGCLRTQPEPSVDSLESADSRLRNTDLYEGTCHITAIYRTGPRVTHMVHAGDLIPAGTILVALD